MNLILTRTRVKIITSNKGSLLEEKINTALEQLENEGKTIEDIQTDISFSGKEGYQAMCTIVYSEDINDKMDTIGFNIDFGIGEPDLDCPSQ